MPWYLSGVYPQSITLTGNKQTKDKDCTAEPSSWWLSWPFFCRSWEVSQWLERMQNCCHFYSLHLLAWHIMSQWLFLSWPQVQQKAPSGSWLAEIHSAGICHFDNHICFKRSIRGCGHLTYIKSEIAVHPILQGDNYLFSCLSWDPKWHESCPRYISSLLHCFLNVEETV